MGLGFDFLQVLSKGKKMEGNRVENISLFVWKMIL